MVVALYRTLVMAILASAGCSQADTDSVQPPAVETIAVGSVWDKARERGVTFRAVGQEPGWLLEMTAGKEILLILDYGQNRISHPWQAGEREEAGHTRYVAGETEILLDERPCSDTMSGEQFAFAVSLLVGERNLTGCGRRLE